MSGDPLGPDIWPFQLLVESATILHLHLSKSLILNQHSSNLTNLLVRTTRGRCHWTAKANAQQQQLHALTVTVRSAWESHSCSNQRHRDTSLEHCVQGSSPPPHKATCSRRMTTQSRVSSRLCAKHLQFILGMLAQTAACFDGEGHYGSAVIFEIPLKLEHIRA